MIKKIRLAFKNFGYKLIGYYLAEKRKRIQQRTNRLPFYDPYVAADGLPNNGMDLYNPIIDRPSPAAFDIY